MCQYNNNNPFYFCRNTSTPKKMKQFSSRCGLREDSQEKMRLHLQEAHNFIPRHRGGLRDAGNKQPDRRVVVAATKRRRSPLKENASPDHRAPSRRSRATFSPGPRSRRSSSPSAAARGQAKHRSSRSPRNNQRLSRRSSSPSAPARGQAAPSSSRSPRQTPRYSRHSSSPCTAAREEATQEDTERHSCRPVPVQTGKEIPATMPMPPMPMLPVGHTLKALPSPPWRPWTLKLEIPA